MKAIFRGEECRNVKKCAHTVETESQVNCIQSHLSRKDPLCSLLIIKYCKRIRLFSLHALSELDHLTTGKTQKRGGKKAAYQLCQCLDFYPIEYFISLIPII